MERLINFRPLKSDEIECRVAIARESGVYLLLYKNARCDMNILDETVSPERWQREHYECKGNLFCRVGIEIDGKWVWKSDCGAESYAEKEKGEASDSFKRACVNWGIGRELYTAPFIWISSESGNVTMEQNKGKWNTRDTFAVEKILIENGTITGLAIKNTSLNKRAFVWKKQ